MSFGSSIGLNLVCVLGICTAIWVLSLLRRDASIIDIFWGAGFVVIAWLTAINADAMSSRSATLTGMVTLWGIRLSAYLAWRNWGKPEDHRYANMRAKHGDRFTWVSLFTVFGLQGVLMWIIAFPLQWGILEAQPWGLTATAGVLVWLVGLAFESIGDYQLARFKADPRNQGRVLDSGLWRYTRHPNYFGDFLVWWGFYLVSYSASSYWTIFSPLLMSFLLLRVSGVRLLESSLRRRVDGYEQYVHKTSPFFPLPPRDVAAK